MAASASRRGGLGVGSRLAGDPDRFQNPLDRYVAEHPDLLTEKSSPECATTDLANETIAGGQLGCAARELALGAADAARYGKTFKGTMMSMTDEGLLERVAKSGGRHNGPRGRATFR